MVDLKAKVNSTLVGAAGEHFVISQLLLQGLHAGLAPIGAKGIDILTMSADGEIGDRIQVKTSRGRRSWQMGVTHEQLDEKSPLFVFVAFTSAGQDLFVVPGHVVGGVIRESHRIWLDTPGKKGQDHHDNPMRMVHYDYQNLEVPCAPLGWMEPYRDAWHHLSTI